MNNDGDKHSSMMMMMIVMMMIKGEEQLASIHLGVHSRLVNEERGGGKKREMLLLLSKVNTNYARTDGKPNGQVGVTLMSIFNLFIFVFSSLNLLFLFYAFQFRCDLFRLFWLLLCSSSNRFRTSVLALFASNCLFRILVFHCLPSLSFSLSLSP